MQSFEDNEGSSNRWLQSVEPRGVMYRNMLQVPKSFNIYIDFKLCTVDVCMLSSALGASFEHESSSCKDVRDSLFFSSQVGHLYIFLPFFCCTWAHPKHN